MKTRTSPTVGDENQCEDRYAPECTSGPPVLRPWRQEEQQEEYGGSAAGNPAQPNEAGYHSHEARYHCSPEHISLHSHSDLAKQFDRQTDRDIEGRAAVSGALTFEKPFPAARPLRAREKPPSTASHS